MASLKITEGPAAGTAFALGAHQLVLVGRDDECTFQILDDAVSRRHMQIRFDDDAGVHSIIDRESSNGVWVNGSRVQDEAPLDDGDTIRIGKTVIVYEGDDPDDALTRLSIMRRRGEHQKGTFVEDWPDP